MASDVIRSAVPSDAEAICRLNREFNGEDTADADAIRARLANPGVEHCLVCERDGEIVGFVCGICFSSLCYRDPVAQMTELYVQPSARRSGVARALVTGMIRHLRSLGAAEITLLTGGDNHAARALYESCGFQHEDERCYQIFFE